MVPPGGSWRAGRGEWGRGSGASWMALPVRALEEGAGEVEAWEVELWKYVRALEGGRGKWWFREGPRREGRGKCSSFCMASPVRASEGQEAGEGDVSSGGSWMALPVRDSIGNRRQT